MKIFNGQQGRLVFEERCCWYEMHPWRSIDTMCYYDTAEWFDTLVSHDKLLWKLTPRRARLIYLLRKARATSSETSMSTGTHGMGCLQKISRQSEKVGLQFLSFFYDRGFTAWSSSSTPLQGNWTAWPNTVIFRNDHRTQVTQSNTRDIYLNHLIKYLSDLRKILSFKKIQLLEIVFGIRHWQCFIVMLNKHGINKML